MRIVVRLKDLRERAYMRRGTYDGVSQKVSALPVQPCRRPPPRPRPLCCVCISTAGSAVGPCGAQGARRDAASPQRQIAFFLSDRRQIPQVESSPPSTLQGNTLTRADYRIDRNGAGGVRVISKTQRALLTPEEIWRRVEAYRAGTEQITARHGHCPS